MTTSREANERLGGRITQFLTQDEVEFVETYGSWTGTNASLSVEKLFRFRAKYNTMRVMPVSGTTISIAHDEKKVTNEFSLDAMTLTAFVYPLKTVTASITTVDNLGSSETSPVITLPALKWTLLRGPDVRVVQVLGSIYFSSTINFSGTEVGSAIYIAHPSLTNAFAFTDNDFVRECLVYMPPILPEVDSEQTYPTFPLARMMDTGLVYADRGFQQSISFRYVDKEMGYDPNDDTSKSTLVDYETAEPEYLPWLAQFVGVKLLTTPAGTTPWGNLPTTWEDIQLDIDPAADETYTISSITRVGSVVTATLTTTPSTLSIGEPVTVTGTAQFNGQFILTDVNTGAKTLEWTSSGNAVTETSGSVTYVDESWIEIEAFDTADANFIPGRRDLIRTARTGLNAGSKQSIIDAVLPILTGTKSYNYVLDSYNNPWHISLETLTSETPGGVTGVESESIIRSVERCRPVGFTISHVCVTSL